MKYATRFTFLVICKFFSLSLFAQAPKNDLSYLTSGGKLKPLQANMDIRHYNIILDIDIPNKSISGFTEVDMILAKNSDTILLDLIHIYTIQKVKVNDKAATFTQKDDQIFITGSGSFNAGNQKVLIEYSGVPPVAVRPPWNGGFTWSKDANNNPWVVINCQMEGGKIYFPCKDHPSDEPNEGVDMKITVPKDLVVAGPGLLQNVSKPKNDKVTYFWKTNYPISNYCVLFNIAKYHVVNSTYTTINGNTVPMQYYVLAQDSANAMHVLEVKARDTKILEKYFGEYPWVKEKIGLADVTNPGMEHQTMITYGGKVTYQQVGGQDYSANLFHEYAHEWWANKVTNKDWAHMWIQEGIATYAEALCFRELGGDAAYEQMINGHRRSVKNRKAMVLGDEVTEAETYSGGDIYTKGSFFMHSLRYIIGDEIFFPTLKKLATDPAYTYYNTVTTMDVEQLFSKESGINLKPYFDFYLRTTDVMDFSIKETAFHTWTIKLNNFVMPLPVDITTSRGKERLRMEKDGISILSDTPPQVDAGGHYLKKVSTY